MTKEQRREFVYPVDEEQFVDDGLPRKLLSPSQFDRYRKCPRQYEYIYVKGLRKPPGVAQVKGSSVHKGAEVTHLHTIETGKPLSLEEATQAVADRWEKDVKNIEEWIYDDKEVTPGEMKDRAILNFQIYYQQAVPAIHPVAVEKMWAVKIGSVPVRGIIDLIDRVPVDLSKDDEVPTTDMDPEKENFIEVVSDLKVTKRKWPDSKVREAPQLTFYALAENVSRVRVDFLLDQKSGTHYKTVRSERTMTDKRILTEDVEQIAELIKQGVFPRCDPTLTNWVCTPKWCGYYEMCKGPK